MSRAPLSVQCRDELFYMSSVDARRARCPSCGAQPGNPCITATGKERGEPHAARWYASRKQLTELRGMLSEGVRHKAPKASRLRRPRIKSKQRPLLGGDRADKNNGV